MCSRRIEGKINPDSLFGARTRGLPPWGQRLGTNQCVLNRDISLLDAKAPSCVERPALKQTRKRKYTTPEISVSEIFGLSDIAKKNSRRIYRGITSLLSPADSFDVESINFFFFSTKLVYIPRAFPKSRFFSFLLLFLPLSFDSLV